VSVTLYRFIQLFALNPAMIRTGNFMGCEAHNQDFVLLQVQITMLAARDRTFATYGCPTSLQGFCFNALFLLMEKIFSYATLSFTVSR
jgi:hypothetical protein